MFICTINLMKLKAIEKYQEEIVLNPNYCFNCDLIEGNNNSANFREENRKIFACLKCNRCFYCSITCLKKIKSKHDLICYKYAEKFNEVNEIIEKYIKV